MISKKTAWMIVHRDDIHFTEAGPNEAGKYMGIICLGVADRYRILATTEYIFGSADEAVTTLKAYVEKLKTNTVAPCPAP
jgi:hypothetical protein